MGRRMGIDTVQIAANVAVLRHMMVHIVGLFASISDDVDGLMDQMDRSHQVALPTITVPGMTPEEEEEFRARVDQAMANLLLAAREHAHRIRRKKG